MRQQLLLLWKTTQGNRPRRLNLVGQSCTRRFIHHSSSCNSTTFKDSLQEAISSPKNTSKVQTNDDNVKIGLGAPPAKVSSRFYIDNVISRLNSTHKQQLSTNDPSFWKDVLERCQSTDNSINLKNFGGIVLSTCIKYNDLDIASHYLKWDKSPTISVLSCYLLLLERSGKPCTEDEIISIYKQLKKMNRNIWDLTTVERIIPALCQTMKWKDSFELIEKCKIGGSSPRGTTYNHIITAAFKNNEIELGWNLLHEIGRTVKIPDSAFVAYLQNCNLPVVDTLQSKESNSNSSMAAAIIEEPIQKIVNFLDYYEHYPSIELINEFKTYFETNMNYIGTIDAKIKQNGCICMNCNTILEKNEITAEEFQNLSTEFLTRVLEDEDIFLNTTPEELKNYKAFINNSIPFDIVVDGLNVALGMQKNIKMTDANKATKLERAIKSLKKHYGFQRILIIGRKHMKRWPGFNYLHENAKIYLIDNQSEDDPFIIYATLKSGPITRFVSNDLMRNHTFRLQDPILGRLFKRWRLSRQYYSEHRWNSDRIKLIPFVSILPVAQKNLKNNIWHIPFSNEVLKSCYDIPTQWVCLKPKKWE